MPDICQDFPINATPDKVFRAVSTSPGLDEWWTARPPGTWVRFWHTGWQDANEHYRISCHCWAMYLRILRRYLEHGESVPYERRLEA